MDLISTVAEQLNQHFATLTEVEFADLVDAEVERRRGDC